MAEADAAAPQIESMADLGDDKPQALALRWITEIKLYEKKRERFDERAKKILKRYKDERASARVNDARMNVFWANVETLKPTVYARAPKPVVKRRYRDDDPVARVAATIVERGCDYWVEEEDGFDLTLRACRDDYLTVGLGVSWQRYVPHWRKEPVFQIESVLDGDGTMPHDAAMPPMMQTEAGETVDPAEVLGDEDAGYYVERLDYEEIADDYVHWSDWGHNAGARTWQEVYAVWRKAYMTRQELRERFDATIGPDAVMQIPLDAKPEGLGEDDAAAEQFKKACIYEIWDKATKRAIWLHKGYTDGPLDVRRDPLRVTGFFPCPKPLFATLAHDDLIPVPDYAQYQDQLDEIDKLTTRIEKLTDAMRLRGMYNAAHKNVLERVMDEADEADLIPVDAEALMGQAGGLQNAIVWVPIDQVAAALKVAYEAREMAKGALYEISGISDILRGDTDPDETARAQSLKAQWGSVRVREKQSEIQRFARDMLRIKADILVEHFDQMELLKIANVESLPEADQQLIPAALQLLADDRMRSFRIEIETDSTIAADEQADKQTATEFLTGMVQYVNGWLPVLQAAPQMAPLFGEGLKLIGRKFQAGDAMESAIEGAVETILQLGQQAQQPPPPDPAQEAQTQADMARAEAEVIKSQADVQKTGLELSKAQVEAATLPIRLQANQMDAARQASQMVEGGI